MQIPKIAGAWDPRIPVAEIYNVLTKRLMSVCVLCLVGTAAAMGSGRKKLNPKLAGELEQFLRTGKEEEEYGATSPKQSSYGG